MTHDLQVPICVDHAICLHNLNSKLVQAQARQNPSMEKGKWEQSPTPGQEAIATDKC